VIPTNPIQKTALFLCPRIGRSPCSFFFFVGFFPHPSQTGTYVFFSSFDSVSDLPVLFEFQSAPFPSPVFFPVFIPVIGFPPPLSFIPIELWFGLLAPTYGPLSPFLPFPPLTFVVRSWFHSLCYNLHPLHPPLMLFQSTVIKTPRFYLP